MSVSLQLILSRVDVEDVERSTQSCVDHSILALFEDSTVGPEVSDKVLATTQLVMVVMLTPTKLDILL